MSGDHPRDYIAQQDRAKERVDYGQGDFGLQGRGRECGQEVDEDLSAQEQQGGGARYEERWLQAKPGCCKRVRSIGTPGDRGKHSRTSIKKIVPETDDGNHNAPTTASPP